MRWTYGMIAASTCAILVLAAFWPQNNPQGPLAPNVVVSDETADPSSGIAGPGAAAPDGLATPTELDARARIEAKLHQPLESIQFLDVPLADVLAYLGNTLEIDFLVNQPMLVEFGYTLDDLVTIELHHGKISTHTLLEIMFEQLGWQDDIGYTIRDEIVYITSRDALLETVVYNCRDLFPAPAEGMGMPGGFGGGPAYGSGGTASQLGPISGTGPPTIYSGDLGVQLIQVVQTTIEPESWMSAGGSGNIQIFGGLMIVKNSQAVHREVKNLLDMMRKANEAGPPNAVGQPTSTGLMQGEVPPGSGSGFF